MKIRTMLLFIIIVGIILVDVFIFKDSFLFRTSKKIELPEWFYAIPQSRDTVSQLYAIGISDINEDKMEAFEQADERARALLSFAYACECNSLVKDFYEYLDNGSEETYNFSMTIKLTSHLIERSSMRVIERCFLKNNIAISLVSLPLHEDIEVMNNKHLEIKYYASEIFDGEDTYSDWVVEFFTDNKFIDTSLSNDQIESLANDSKPKVNYKSSRNFGKNKYPEWYFSFSKEQDLICSSRNGEIYPIKSGLFSAYLSALALVITNISEQIELNYSEKVFKSSESTRPDSITLIDTIKEMVTSNSMKYLFVDKIDFVEDDNGQRIVLLLRYPVNQDIINMAISQKHI